jgi:sialate O-acetylesterase
MQKILPFLIVALLCGYRITAAIDLQLEIDLKGDWLIEIGDDSTYAHPNFDDSRWEVIRVPSRWENEGFPGYDGYAWYRINFNVPIDMKTENLYLKLGRIDDVDRVYLNGQFIGGKGHFPPNYQSAWEVKRLYPISVDLLLPGEKNTLAVRVYDAHGGGGIRDGEIGIYTRLDLINLILDLSGQWRFSPLEFEDWTAGSFVDTLWDEINVPGPSTSTVHS